MKQQSNCNNSTGSAGDFRKHVQETGTGKYGS
jgi:hypothetical protein